MAGLNILKTNTEKNDKFWIYPAIFCTKLLFSIHFIAQYWALDHVAGAQHRNFYLRDSWSIHSESEKIPSRDLQSALVVKFLFLCDRPIDQSEASVRALFDDTKLKLSESFSWEMGGWAWDNRKHGPLGTCQCPVETRQRWGEERDLICPEFWAVGLSGSAWTMRSPFGTGPASQGLWRTASGSWRHWTVTQGSRQLWASTRRSSCSLPSPSSASSSSVSWTGTVSRKQQNQQRYWRLIVGNRTCILK